MHKKDFDKWGKKKKLIEKEDARSRVRLRGIYWVSIGENIGFEQNGKNDSFERPVLAIKVFNSNMFLGVPLTSALKNRKSNYYFAITYDNIEYFVILPQVRLFSTKRVLRFVRKIEIEEFKSIKNEMRKLFGL